MEDARYELTPVTHDPFARPAIAAVAPITESQREIWLTVQMDPDGTLAYNEASEIRMRGALDVERLRRCWQTIVERHEALRASFSPDGEWMCIRESIVLDIPFEDLRDLDAAAREARLEAIRSEQVRLRFDLERGPLLSVRVACVGADDHRVFFTAHHIIVDGWSAAEIYKDFARLYDGSEVAPAPSFCSFARDEAAWRQTPEGVATEEWWLSRFADGVPSYELPPDRPRGNTRQFIAGRVDRRFAPELIAGLRRIGLRSGASLVATTLAAFSALLHRLTGAEDMVIGLAASAQSYLGKTGLVGHAVNLLPLRLQPRADEPFNQFLGEVRSTLLDAFDHQRFTFSTLLPKLKAPRDASRPPLVPVLFNIDVRNDPISPGGIAVDYRTLVREYENFELFVNAVDDGVTLSFECAYSRALYDAATVERWMDRFERLLRALLADATTAIGRLPALTEVERERVVQDFNRTEAPIPSLMLPQWIAQAAQRTPGRIAVTDSLRDISYSQLQAQSAGIAAALAAQGAGRGRFVGLCIERSVLLPSALLGILKTGAAYLPLDPEFPPQRLRDVVEDSGASLLVTDRATRERVADLGVATLLLEDLIAAPPANGGAAAAPAFDDPAYVIYTSGSTGKPKGVVVTHGNLVNFLASMQREPGLKPDDAVLAVTTVSFDIAGLELWLPLVTGAAVRVAEREAVMDGEPLRAVLEKPLADGRRITLLQATPASWRLLLSSGWAGFDRLKALCGGEPLPRDLAEALLRKVGELWNLYGPTETTVWSTASQVTDAARVDIGRPIANTQCHVLDPHLQPLPVGAVGELWIGGLGVAQGYHARPELTAERFVAHAEFGRLYRTGDLAAWKNDGRLNCLGRVDFQVKLRGFRIELGDIEAALNDFDGIADSVCGLRERTPGDPRLIAWCAIAPGAALNRGELRAYLRARLPAYMVPQHFVELEALPRLPNGKLDRKSLPDPFAGDGADAVVKTPPQTPAEQLVADIWREALGTAAPIGRDDRFFDLGGHSLLAAQVTARLSRLAGERLQMRAVLMETLAGLAALLPPAALAAADVGGAARPAATAPASPRAADAAPAVQPGDGEPARSKGLLGRLFGKPR